MARRRALSAGKAALPPPNERVRAGLRAAHLPGAPASPPPPVAAPPDRATATPAVSGRQASLARRRMLSAGKAALQAGFPPEPAAGPTPPASATRLVYAPKVVTSATQHGLCVTGSRIGRGDRVTGDERGTVMPVSGTQYIDAQTGGAWRASGTKVGQARTEGGLVVSGTLVRSAVRITGDERGDQSTITGKADPRPADDLTARPADSGAVAAQFQRQANPHGATPFGANLGRSAGQVGSRQRTRAPALEATEAGAVITGSAVGRSLRVTGDESGACRPISGSQYLAPARRETACGGVGGGTAPAALPGASRPDPVTLSKVSESATWGGQRVTGIDVEHHNRVTGDAPGTCAALTGSQYQGPTSVAGVCAHDQAKSATARRMMARARLAVTGDTPAPSQAVSGLARGAAREVSGTPYYRDEPPAAPPPDPVAALDARFSVSSPQRAAQLLPPRTDGAGRITGSFAVGGGKVTGNVAFVGRAQPPGERKPGHARLSGGGSSAGRVITGDSWADQSRVTGTEGAFAAGRNPTERGAKARPFAGSDTFKERAKHEEPRQLVTGMFGYFSKTGARVTLSGGAQS